jgi:hypothetical protein
MNTNKDGGQAFPVQLVEHVSAHNHPGMTLRDYFAAAALSTRGLYGANVREKEVAEECYRIADAMLAEREKGGK